MYTFILVRIAILHVLIKMFLSTVWKRKSEGWRKACRLRAYTAQYFFSIPMAPVPLWETASSTHEGGTPVGAPLPKASATSGLSPTAGLPAHEPLGDRPHLNIGRNSIASQLSCYMQNKSVLKIKLFKEKVDIILEIYC